MQVLAHGVSSRGDLPLPLWQFSWAAIFAIAVSFVAIGVLWTEPRLAEAAGGRAIPAPRRVFVAAEALARAASFVLFALVLLASFSGTDSAADNISPVAVYVALWVMVQFASALLGDLWRVLSPFDTLALVLHWFHPVSAEAPAWTRWYAPIGVFGFLFLELVHPSGDSPRVLGWAIVLYTVTVMAGVWRWGRAWLQHGELFAVHFGLLAAMAPVARRDGAMVLRQPMSGLAALRMTGAETATLLVVLGGVTWDGFGDSELWRDLVGRHDGWTDAGWRLFGMIDVIAVVAALYLVGIRSMASITKRRVGPLANHFAPSLVPIVLGYTVAHYLQLALDEMQTFVFALSDPLGRGWDLFGGADGSIDYEIIGVDAMAWCQVLAVIVAHIAAVAVAHDRALETFEHRDAVRSQYVMVFVMIVYSVAGLWLLLNA